MNISLNFIKEFVDLPEIDGDELANTFTMTTAEVEDIKTSHAHLKKIFVAEIISLKPHPEADKLNLVTFNYGGKDLKEVVCGAPNVKVGLKVPYAELGVTLPNGLTLEPKKIRGILSEGMLCSEVELGLSSEGSGLMELPSQAKVGDTMLAHLGLETDTILDVDNKSLTHRPDLWGHYGLAREFAASYGKPLKNPFDKTWQDNIEKNFSKEEAPIKPVVATNSSCKAFYGLSVDGISITESPAWLKNRLESLGLRSINSIVDISNYVMVELGIPLHIYDREKIKGNLKIERLSVDQNFKTLDEVERSLTIEDTVICDDEKILTLAGIMGGESSSVSATTKNIFIEVANWKADEVRKTSTRLGLRTDSSQRYEKSLDSKACYRTLLRTLDLVLNLNKEAKVIGAPTYDGEDLSLIKEVTLETSLEKIASVLGYPLTEEKLLSIFHSLEFKTEKKGNSIFVTLPSFRTTKDMSCEADLIEEVGRMIGYDNIEPVAPKFEVKATRFTNEKTLQRKIQDFMIYHGRSLEVMTYPLIGEKLLEKASWGNHNNDLVLVNALSTDADRMRPSLIPHGLQTVSINAKNYERFSFFEIGRTYSPSGKDFASEKNELIIGLFDSKKSRFIELLNTVESLFRALDLPMSLEDKNEKFKNPLIDSSWLGVHPHEYQNIKVMGKFVGLANTCHPMVLRNFKTKGYFSFAVIDLSSFEKNEAKDKTKYEALSKFPASHFDLTVVVKKDEKATNTLEVLKKVKLKELTDKKISDLFILENGDKAVTLTLRFEDKEKTLAGDFLTMAHDLVIKTLTECGYPLRV